MNDLAKRTLLAQWAYDTRPVLGRFHLWLEDVEVDRSQTDPVSAHSFTGRGISRCLAMTSATTALGARLFGRFGQGKGADKITYNQVKKAADAISAYVMSEGLWALTRNLPENHAVMVSLGEGLMPKAGETPEMGSNPLLGFGRVYARPEVARAVDNSVNRLLNDKRYGWDGFSNELRDRGITVWGAAVDTLENTSRFAEGRETGPMAVLHLFDSPLKVTRPYESYMGALTLPRKVVSAAADASLLIDFRTPRSKVVQAIEVAYPGIARKNIHVWTLSGKSRTQRLGGLWAQWKELGCHLVEDGWVTPKGLPAFCDSGTYAPTFMVGSWQDGAGETNVFLCDGYAATAEAMQAASLSEVFDVDCTMAPFSPKFELPLEKEYELMRLEPKAASFRQDLQALFGTTKVDDDRVTLYGDAIKDARDSDISLDHRVLRADDFLPVKAWRVLSCSGYMCDDPYTGIKGVEELPNNRYRVNTLLATRNAQSRISFTFRLMESLEQTRLVFSPLLVRFLEGIDYTQRPVKVSDSGRIRNELQTMLSQALEHDGDAIAVHWEKVDEKVMPREQQLVLHRALGWYKKQHPAWFGWLSLMGEP